MAWLSDIIQSFTQWLGGHHVPQPQSPPPQASLRHASQAVAKVAQATASIANAYDQRATTFSVTHEGQSYLVASAHLTNNIEHASTGFNYKGKRYFLVVRGESLALAEHLAFNPQGFVCAADGRFDPEKPFRDISLLRLQSPEQTRAILTELSDSDTTRRLRKALSYYPSLSQYSKNARLKGDELAALTNRFTISSLDISNHENPSARTHAVTFAAGAPQPLHFSSAAEPLNPTRITATFDCHNEIQLGNSGSLVFSVSEKGAIVPVGIITAVSRTATQGYITAFSEVLQGLKALKTATIANQGKTLAAACHGLQGAHAWLSPNGLLPLPPLPQQQAGTQNASANGAKREVAPICPR